MQKTIHYRAEKYPPCPAASNYLDRILHHDLAELQIIMQDLQYFWQLSQKSGEQCASKVVWNSFNLLFKIYP